MQKISNYIFNLSPKRLAIYLILGPLILSVIYTITSLIIRKSLHTHITQDIVSYSILGFSFVILTTFVCLWLFWLISTVLSVKKTDLRLPIAWFHFAIVLLIIYFLFTLSFSFIKSIPEEYQYIFYALNEFVAFGGLLVAYPILSYYSAKAIAVKKYKQSVNLLNTLPFFLLLFFGTVVAIPFLHKYFSTKSSMTSQILIIYAIAFGFFIVFSIVAFFASLTGLI